MFYLMFIASISTNDAHVLPDGGRPNLRFYFLNLTNSWFSLFLESQNLKFKFLIDYEKIVDIVSLVFQEPAKKN
jgi:hypothetical protein